VIRTRTSSISDRLAYALRVDTTASYAWRVLAVYRGGACVQLKIDAGPAAFRATNGLWELDDARLDTSVGGTVDRATGVVVFSDAALRAMGVAGRMRVAELLPLALAELDARGAKTASAPRANPTVQKIGERPRQVRDLRWLNRHSKDIQTVYIDAAPAGATIRVALRDGGEFVGDWHDLGLALGFFDRPRFRGVDLVVNGSFMAAGSQAHQEYKRLVAKLFLAELAEEIRARRAVRANPRRKTRVR